MEELAMPFKDFDSLESAIVFQKLLKLEKISSQLSKTYNHLDNKVFYSILIYPKDLSKILFIINKHQ